VDLGVEPEAAIADRTMTSSLVLARNAASRNRKTGSSSLVRILKSTVIFRRTGSMRAIGESRPSASTELYSPSGTATSRTELMTVHVGATWVAAL
jgi:hypothetical protein